MLPPWLEVGTPALVRRRSRSSLAVGPIYWAALRRDEHRPICGHRVVSVSLASTPEPPYVAVIFTSLRTEGDNGYAVMSARMEELVASQPGFLGVESARERLGITVSYWKDEASAAAWKQVAEHTIAQERGKTAWYSEYQVRIATVTRTYGSTSS